MKFIRRPDLGKVTRTEIAAQAVLARGVYGEMTRLARCYHVSRRSRSPCRSRWWWLEPFDEQGRLLDLAQRQAEIGAVLELLASLGSTSLAAEVKSLAAGLAGYWGYYERLATVYEALCEQHPPAVVAALACGWQRERQATNSKDYGVRKRWQQAAQAHYDEAARLAPEDAVARQQAVVEACSAEVRSSSLIENVNSALRPLLETSRGQVRQETLDLFAFVHNRQRFQRGQRAGRAPLEILTGEVLEQSWLEELLALG